MITRKNKFWSCDNDMFSCPVFKKNKLEAAILSWQFYLG